MIDRFTHAMQDRMKNKARRIPIMVISNLTKSKASFFAARDCFRGVLTGKAELKEGGRKSLEYSPWWNLKAETGRRYGYYLRPAI
jgi:hypothetical protein